MREGGKNDVDAKWQVCCVSSGCRSESRSEQDIASQRRNKIFALDEIKVDKLPVSFHGLCGRFSSSRNTLR